MMPSTKCSGAGVFDPLGHQSARHVFVHRNRRAVTREQSAGNVLHGLVVNGEHVPPKQFPHFLVYRVDELRRIFFVGRLRGDANVYLTRMREHPDRWISRFGDKLTDPIIDGAFPNLGYLQHPAG